MKKFNKFNPMFGSVPKINVLLSIMRLKLTCIKRIFFYLFFCTTLISHGDPEDFFIVLEDQTIQNEILSKLLNANDRKSFELTCKRFYSLMPERKLWSEGQYLFQNKSLHWLIEDRTQFPVISQNIIYLTRELGLPADVLYHAFSYFSEELAQYAPLFMDFSRNLDKVIIKKTAIRISPFALLILALITPPEYAGTRLILVTSFIAAIQYVMREELFPPIEEIVKNGRINFVKRMRRDLLSHLKSKIDPADYALFQEKLKTDLFLEIIPPENESQKEIYKIYFSFLKTFFQE